MRVAAVVQARMGSTRLPGKALLHLGGRPVLWHIVQRLTRARRVSEVWMATTDLPRDDVIAQASQGWGVPVVRGSEADVLQRTWQTAYRAGADLVVRIPSDKPLVDPGMVDDVIAAAADSGADYATNMPERWPEDMTFPYGLEVEVVTAGALERAHREAADPPDREHGLTYIYRRPETFRICRVAVPPALARPEFRLALDTPEDYDVMQHVYTLWQESDGPLDVREVLEYLTGHPDVAARNRRVVQRRV